METDHSDSGNNGNSGLKHESDSDETYERYSMGMDVDSVDGNEGDETRDADVLKQVLNTITALTAQVAHIQLQLDQEAAQRASIFDPIGEEIFEETAKVKQGRRSRTKEEKTLRQIVRQKAQEMFQFNNKAKPHLWPAAQQERADGFNAGLLPKDGPTADHLFVDWNVKGLSPWTADCLTIFTHAFLRQHYRGEFPLLKDSVTQVRIYAACRDYILYLKRIYRKETQDPVGAAKAKGVADKRSRSLNRRKQLLNRRLAMMKHHAFPGVAIQLVEKLDVDGMSSESSEGEIGVNRSFKIKRLPWRNQELAQWLQRIDAMPTKNRQNSVLTRRCGHRRRVWSDKVSNRRGPVTQLPINIYNAEWMQQQGERAIRRIGATQEQLSLPKIDSLTPVA